MTNIELTFAPTQTGILDFSSYGSAPSRWLGFLMEYYKMPGIEKVESLWVILGRMMDVEEHPV